MGKPILVDSDDLETLLFACGALKDVENAIVAQKSSPMALKAAPKLTGAHERVAASWRRQLREALPEPTDGDLAELKRLFPLADEEVQVLTAPIRLGQVLQLVEYGPILRGAQIEWPHPAGPEFRPSGHEPVRFAVRLTPRGRNALGL